jgi:hypothetical protein
MQSSAQSTGDTTQTDTANSVRLNVKAIADFLSSMKPSLQKQVEQGVSRKFKQTEKKMEKIKVGHFPTS